MITLSTHVLDAAFGAPASGMHVTVADSGGDPLASDVTDHDGRVAFDLDLEPGTHLLTYETGVWFGAQQRDTFFPAVGVAFEVDDAADEHYHVALLLSPYSYTTYRGS